MRRCAKREGAINRFFDVPMAVTFRRQGCGSLDGHNRWRRGPAIEPAGKSRHRRREKRRHERECCRGSKPHCSIHSNPRTSKCVLPLTLERTPGCILEPMDKCCDAPDAPDAPVAGTHAVCAHCGSKGASVDVLTVKALLRETALRRLVPVALYFCQEPTCSVVYFAAGGEVFTSSDVRVPVWQKEPTGSRRICYCFDENEGSMLRELAETGRCGAIQRVREHIAADRCACEVRNPRGRCCLGDLMKAVARLETGCISGVEK